MPSNYTIAIGVGATWVLGCRTATRFPAGRFPALLSTWLIVASAVELAAIALIMMHCHNVIMYNFWWPTEFALLVLMGQTLHPWKRGWLAGFFAVFGIIYLWDLFSIDPFTTAVTRSMITGDLMLSAYYLWLFWKIANTWQGRLRDATAVWLCLAVLVHAGPAGPLLGSYNYFRMVDPQLAHRIFRVNQIFCIAKFILMGVTCLRMKALPTGVSHGA